MKVRGLVELIGYCSEGKRVGWLLLVIVHVVKDGCATSSSGTVQVMRMVGNAHLVAGLSVRMYHNNHGTRDP